MRRAHIAVVLGLVIGGVAAGWGQTLATGEPAANVGGDGYLIRNASLVLTMDPHLGERGILGQLKNADVLIVGDRIAAVGVHLAAPSGVHVIDGRGRIVMPGFVETHNHLWQSLVRGCEHDESFPGWATDCILPLLQTGIVLREDAYAAVRLSTLDTLSTGTTTSVEFSHAPSEAFADGTLDALEDSGMRFVLAYRFRVGREAHVRDLVQNRITPNPLATFQIGGPVPAPSDAALADLRAALAMARELCVMLNLHFLETLGDRAANPVGVLQTVGALDHFAGRLLLDHAMHA